MLPWFKFYPADYLLDAKVDSLSIEAQGILLRLWCLCARDGAIPDDYKTLARRAGIPPNILGKSWAQVRTFFRSEGGLLLSDRMIREQASYGEIAEKRKIAGASGGRKAQANARANRDQLLERSDSDSDSDRKDTKAPAPASALTKRPKAAPKLKAEKLKSTGTPNSHLLEEDRPSFWEALKAFPGQKVVNPTLAAKAFSSAVASGQVTGPELVGCMKRYRATFAEDRTQFMVQAHAWLEGAGFMIFLEEERLGAPVPRAVQTASSPGPMHKRPLTAEDRAYLEQMP